jgi:hypothetical protein
MKLMHQALGVKLLFNQCRGGSSVQPRSNRFRTRVMAGLLAVLRTVVCCITVSINNNISVQQNKTVLVQQ